MLTRSGPYRTPAVRAAIPIRWYIRLAAWQIEIVYGVWLLWPLWVGMIVGFTHAALQRDAKAAEEILSMWGTLFFYIQIGWIFYDGVKSIRHPQLGYERPFWYWKILYRAKQIRTLDA